jgi:hypothetical protein
VRLSMTVSTAGIRLDPHSRRAEQQRCSTGLVSGTFQHSSAAQLAGALQGPSRIRGRTKGDMLLLVQTSCAFRRRAPLFTGHSRTQDAMPQVLPLPVSNGRRFS